MPKRVVDDAPRPTNFPENVLAFPELENFLSQDPDDAKQTSWTAIRDENDLNYIGGAKQKGLDSDPENRWKDEDANKSLDMIVPLDKDRDDSMEFEDDQ